MVEVFITAGVPFYTDLVREEASMYR